MCMHTTCPACTLNFLGHRCVATHFGVLLECVATLALVIFYDDDRRPVIEHWIF
jgi:hypothetical protein